MLSKHNSRLSVLLGAAFLMATSAIGPGFLTQTTVFTASLQASFGFVILISILLDIGVQLNIWRIIVASGKKAPEIANILFPGTGHFLSVLIVLGGLIFNIGNIAGAGLGLNVLLGIPVSTGALISAVIAIVLFVIKDALRAMDTFSKWLGILMIILTLYVVYTAHPPLGLALQKSIVPDTMNVTAIITLVGGTVGGYITFSGAHRLLDAGVKGKESMAQTTRGAVTGIGIASVMRILLFLAALGVVMQGLPIAQDNPPASMFKQAAGITGYKIFGLVMWSAAITSVVGSAYTSVSFLRTMHVAADANAKAVTIVFIAISGAIFLLTGNPVTILIAAGAVNGMILPVSLLIMLLAIHKPAIAGTYKHPWILTVLGVIVMLIMGWMSVKTIAALMHL
ncbi:Mn2+ and Fe2+ transporters of the NRAMP family [Filimonas lacunae]|uniref:Mn2+ and Fe2+ transporters of the NRAMP family n=1 Tax=Filimonas lacunae TaxID=477680 RepID=A0A173MPW6_9BACT|nr:NRAMP family divalent metal transporter [Filimonas lacunae]BAV09723.1 Mn2+/Fe2+ transporter, NRAMP family [Filimonas lacunae]SIS77898.1 Mn2+ and Fe2+ transporters of the NRAMP family [Filimonas lacunae]